MFDWFKKKYGSKNDDEILRVVLMLGELPGSFRPTAYMNFDIKSDLFQESEKFEILKQEALEECKLNQEYNKSSGYVICDIPVSLISSLLILESKFLILNSHLKLELEDCFTFPIRDMLNDPGMTDKIKTSLMFLNYVVKLYKIINFDRFELESIYKIDSSDIRITGDGCIEKFVVNVFEEFECIFYRVNISPNSDKEEK